MASLHLLKCLKLTVGGIGAVTATPGLTAQFSQLGLFDKCFWTQYSLGLFGKDFLLLLF